MTKHDKKMGREKAKHRPVPPPQSMRRGPKKPEPRYRVERFYGERWGWMAVAKCRRMVEAQHEMLKQFRDKFPVCMHVRIVSTLTGEVVGEEKRP